MSESNPHEKSQIHFNELPFDPESSGKADPEKILKIREGEQAHRFRDCVFWCMMGFLVIVAFIWAVMMLRAWPPSDAGLPVVLFLGSKITLITAVLLIIAISPT